MKMRKVISLLMAWIMLFTSCGTAFAEPVSVPDVQNLYDFKIDLKKFDADSGLIGDSLRDPDLDLESMDIFSDAWEAFSDWVGSTWHTVSEWVAGTWGSASKWVSAVWTDSATWLTEIWGDVSTWTSSAYQSVAESVSSWLADALNTVTDTTQGAWSWLKGSFSKMSSGGQAFLDRIKKAYAEGGDGFSQKAMNIFYELLSVIGVSEEDADRILRTLIAYGLKEGLSEELGIELSLPFLLKLVEEFMSEGGVSVDAVAIAQFLTAALQSLLEGTGESGNELLNMLKNILSGL